MIPAIDTICRLLNDDDVCVAELMVQAWLPAPDNEYYPMIPLLDRLVALRPGVDSYELRPAGAHY